MNLKCVLLYAHRTIIHPEYFKFIKLPVRGEDETKNLMRCTETQMYRHVDEK